MDIYSTSYLVGAVGRIRPLPTFILDNYFTAELQHESQDVAIDVVEDKPRITPYVHPLKEGKLVESLGYKTKTVSPAYLKDKRLHNPMKALRRVAGEPLGGSFTNDQRRKMNIIADLNDQLNMFKRRQETMALEVCLTGKIRIQGPGFDNLVDFGRDSSLTESLTGSDRWINEDIDIVEQLEEYADRVFDKSLTGAVVTEIVMDRKAWELFRKNKKVLELLDKRRGDRSDIQLSPMEIKEGIQFKGWFGDFQIFVYKGSYIDPITEQPKNYLPDYTVLFLSKSIDGVRHYGAIMDEKAGIKAMRYFPKSWVEEDPSARLLMLQSAPLLVPYDPNASMALKVHDGGAVTFASETDGLPVAKDENKPKPNRRGRRKVLKTKKDEEATLTDSSEVAGEMGRAAGRPHLEDEKQGEPISPDSIINKDDDKESVPVGNNDD